MNVKTIQLRTQLCLALSLFSLTGWVSGQEQKEVASASAAALEREKAMKNPYPNDFGPDHVDVSKYSPELQAGYKLMIEKCSKCHSASRVLNSQFIDLKEDEIAKLKNDQMDILKNKQIWQVESGIWQRYVKRMMSKPGCNISPDEGKRIWKFVVEDSKIRKTGPATESWRSHRKKLLADFQDKHPDKYKELFGEK